jgi:hypothetical protein
MQKYIFQLALCFLFLFLGIFFLLADHNFLECVPENAAIILENNEANEYLSAGKTRIQMHRNLRLDHSECCRLKGNRVLDITNMKIVLTQRNSANSRPVHHAEELAHVDIDSEWLLSPGRDVNFLEGDQLFVRSPMAGRRRGKYQHGVRAIHGACVFDLQIDTQRDFVTFCVCDPDCLARKGCVSASMAAVERDGYHGGSSGYGVDKFGVAHPVAKWVHHWTTVESVASSRVAV